jgi:curved DNA-binding protein CbpA
MSDLYSDLGFPDDMARADITRAMIRSAYRQLASLHHPDRDGGDAEKFKKVKNAYETLVDEDSRREYDRNGNSAAEAMAFQEKVKEKLALLFAEGVRNNGMTGLVSHMRAMLSQLHSGCRESIAQSEKHIRMLRRDRGRLRTVEGRINAFALMMDANLENEERAIAGKREDLKTIGACLKELNYYEEVELPPEGENIVLLAGAPATPKLLNQMFSDFYGGKR